MKFIKSILLSALCLVSVIQLSAQAQNFSCDSLSYTVLQGLPLTVYGEASGIINMVDSIEWLFSACNSVACYTPQGNNPYTFPQINMTDTVKFCYDAYIYTPNQIIACPDYCDSLIFDYTDSTYVLFSMGGTTSINELTLEKVNNNKIYDLLGRELFYIPRGTMYIQNRKLKLNK